MIEQRFLAISDLLPEIAELILQEIENDPHRSIHNPLTSQGLVQLELLKQQLKAVAIREENNHE